jgi:hypothetical protein
MTRRSALGCGIAGDHRLHRRPSIFLSPTGHDLGDPQTSENSHLHKIQDDGEGDGGNKRAGYHSCRQERIAKPPIARVEAMKRSTTEAMRDQILGRDDHR